LRRFLAGGYPAGIAFALYAASVVTLCVALYECNRRDGTLTASAYGSLLFALLSIIPFLCLLFAGWGAYFSFVRAKRAGGVLASNLSELGQINLRRLLHSRRELDSAIANRSVQWTTSVEQLLRSA
jgi:hypothetical protein